VTGGGWSPRRREGVGHHSAHHTSTTTAAAIAFYITINTTYSKTIDSTIPLHKIYRPSTTQRSTVKGIARKNKEEEGEGQQATKPLQKKEAAKTPSLANNIKRVEGVEGLVFFIPVSPAVSRLHATRKRNMQQQRTIAFKREPQLCNAKVNHSPFFDLFSTLHVLTLRPIEVTCIRVVLVLYQCIKRIYST
jgi:hypothetical protein